nr:uncharacterized protein LOC127330319 [Lolium perenne]
MFCNGFDQLNYIMQMNRQWMYIDRRFDEFTSGLDNFMAVAEANKHGGFMYCPCVDCKNTVNYAHSSLIHSHLLRSGFMPSYYCWTKHGERGVMMEDNDEEEEDDDGYPNFPNTMISAEGNEDNEVEEQEAPDEPTDDDLGRAIADARRECETEKERLAFDKMIEDHNKLLYPTCEDGHKKLGNTLELLQWKAENGVTDSGFGKLLTIIKRKLPRGNELPASTYEAKKIVCPLGLDVQKIHACINDCILYRGEYENLDACPVCTALRYKIRRDDPGDVEGERPRKRVPAKVMWYAPIISRLKRLFRNKEHARLLRWNKQDRKKDVMLRHPADGSQWRKIDREFPNFAQDARNLRFGDYMEKCKKVVYLGHRRFLRLTHPVRKKGKHYNGEADHRRKPPHRDGVDIFGMVKDLDVIFGKGPGGRSVPNDDAGHAPMWKKKSIFWDLPYWEVLEVRSSIDVMHVTKNLCVNLLGFLGVYGKTKDTPEAQEDQQRRKDPKKLHERQTVLWMITTMTLFQMMAGASVEYEDYYPTAQVVNKYRYGSDLVKPGELARLGTQMRRLHEWYLKACRRGVAYLTVYLRDEHYFRGKDEINLELEELFQLFNQDALDKAVISCYCLMKKLEYKRGKLLPLGFIDPNTVHEVTVRDFAKDTEDNIVMFLEKQADKEDIFFPYNFK